MKELGQRKEEWYELLLSSAQAEAVDWLQAELGISAKYARKLNAENGIRVKGNRIAIRLFPREEPQFEPDWNLPELLYEDDFCLVAAKPAGMTVHPSRSEQTDTLANALSGYYQMTGQACRIRHIHRLDEDTTGPVLYAKNELAQLRLDQDMREKTIGRIYLALVHGKLKAKRGTIDAPIGRDRHQSNRYRVSPTGEQAITHYELVEAFNGYSLVRLRLDTGRTHQIRVHMSHLGHPLVGDVLYGGKQEIISKNSVTGIAMGSTLIVTRQALHGEQLEFLHPLTREQIKLSVPLPSDMVGWLERLRLTS
ncbi:MAG: RluA family pseudouridine synthase [Gorillibacterium sp.]|nr:RluA family pseudouridine synthase [Gorillibacterium sp.]